ncbi:hypothetical protein IWW34DRAFT_729654 [Fusarium oxysporum f. sp. albedinis]|nr:hypothetical protein IWW34DRAFT_729654 [Fusarium oxysporum f. sp. albedinis]KAK2484454.1 hypothetical protein H9L39_02434 [Fusarium oxysporum f. sp. albedinis]
MSENRRDSIADDWLEVDSAASVISMDSRPSSPSPSSSSPQETPAPTTQVVASSHAGPSNPTSQSQLPLRPKDNALELSRVIQEQQLFPAQDPNARIYVDPSNPPSRTLLPYRPKDPAVESFPAFQQQQQQQQQQLETLYNGQNQDVETSAPGDLHSYPNPSDYHKACQDATASLHAAAKLAKDIGGNLISTMSLIRSTCEQLCTQTTDLGKMLEVYAQYWASKGSSMALIDIPLNPDTWEAMSELKEVVLKTHNTLSSLVPPADLGRPLTAADIPLHANLELARCLEVLEDIRDLFAEFLPILKADFDEFRTKHMGFPSAALPDRPHKKPHQPPNPKVRQIRDELYAMKDHFVMINVFLSRLKDSHPSPNVTDPLIFKSLKRITTAISNVLTNNPSDWIESDIGPSLSKTMSYAQFMTLDPDVLSDISSHLQDFQDELGVDAKPGEDGCDFSQEMIHNHQEFMLLEGGQLQQLRSVIEFTETILMTQG